MANFLSVFSVAASAYLLVRLSKPADRVEAIILFFLFSTSLIIGSGYLLSSVNRVAEMWMWAGLNFLEFVVILAVILLNKEFRTDAFHPVSFQKKASFLSWLSSLSRFERFTMLPLLITTVLTGLVNLTIVIFVAPGTWDGIAYHLPRMAYYLQHNNLHPFEANYWAQVVHPKNSTLLLLYTYLTSGYNENLTQIVQYISYWIFVGTIYGISLQVGIEKKPALFSSLIGSLLIEPLLQATALFNDMILAGYAGVVLYCLFSFRKGRRIRYLFYAALGFSIALGVKASFFLVIPVIFLTLVYVVFLGNEESIGRQLLAFSLAGIFVIGCCTFLTLPSGYVDNSKLFGNIVGPASVRDLHTYGGKSLQRIVIDGTKNLVRFGSDFFTLDGLPAQIIGTVQHNIRKLFVAPFNALHIDLSSTEGIGSQVWAERFPAAHEGQTYWGILGFGLIIPMIITGLLSKTKSRDQTLLAVAAVVYFIVQSYTLPYEVWRGRYFLSCAALSVPLVGSLLLTKNPVVRLYVATIVILGCCSAVSALALKTHLINDPYSQGSTTSIFNMNRMEQLTRDQPQMCESMERFDNIVPRNATVAVGFRENEFEYPLFGERLSRTLVSINSFINGVQPIPPIADYLVYSYGYPYPDSSDLYLGGEMFLRKLK